MSEDDHLLLPVPEFIRAIYLVPTCEPPADPAGIVRIGYPARWPGILDYLLTDLLNATVTGIDVLPTEAIGSLPIDQLALMGATDEQLRRLDSATHLVIVTVQGRSGWPPVHEWAARAVATLIAEHLEADVVDLAHTQILPTHQAAASLPDAHGNTPLVDWVSVEHFPGRGGYLCTTTGLRRFGLPELQTPDVPAALTVRWGRVLIGVAYRLLTIWSALTHADPLAAFLHLPAELAISADDVAAGYVANGSTDAPAAVLRLATEPGPDPHRHSFLTVTPPAGFAGTAAEHLEHTCHTLFGARADRRAATADEVMQKAIDIARSGLPGIRERFESAALGPQAALLVKYNLPSPDGEEYLWAYVTSWSEPERIAAVSADNAVYDPAVRRGRPVVIPADSVVDWAVEDATLGIVEGGWTQAALDGC